MQEKKTSYINQLLDKLNGFENKIRAFGNEQEIPFSFFREAFETTQEITHLLHELEFLQIEDMKQQMEKLIVVLSEAENRQTVIVESHTEPIIAEPAEAQITNIAPETEPVIETPRRNPYAENIVMPEFRKPVIVEEQDITVAQNGNYPAEAEKIDSDALNDKIVPPTTVADKRYSLSLNDRFLFQRELFHNNKAEMTDFMAKMNAFDNVEQAESYMRENTAWNFDDETVKSFVTFIRKGF